MDNRLKKNLNVGRESRATHDESRQSPESNFALTQERRRMFRETKHI
jgi:hypothetical protein